MISSIVTHRTLGQYAFLVGTVVSLTVAVFHAYAQSPSSIGGRTIQLAIASGIVPFASSGVYRLLPSGVDNSYAIVPISGNIAASTGTHTYSKTGASTARLSLVDGGVGGLTVNCMFGTPDAGTYTVTSATVPGASQTGYFVLYAGASPTGIAGSTVTIDITSGEFPFASGGSYRFLPTASGTYTTIALWGNVQSSSGAYSYSQNSAYTGVITFDDVMLGQGLTFQLSFDAPTTGTIFLRKVGSTGYQTGVFSMTTPDVPPLIATQPSRQTLNVGATAVFGVSASGTAPLAYQWRKNGVNIDGANLATYTIASVQPPDQGTYDVVVSNSAGSVTSSAGNLVVVVPPTITSHPTSVTVNMGASTTFSVTVTGTLPLSYQWRRNQIDITGANLAAYTVANVQDSDAGSYSVRVSNAAGAITSNPATLQIIPIVTSHPVFETPRWSSPAGFSLALRGQAQTWYRIQRSTNLVNWFDLTNLMASGVLTQIVDQDATNELKRFYRAVVQDSGDTNQPPGNPDPAHLVWIPAGTFTMGSPSTEQDRYGNEGPQTQVTLSTGFWISKYETTQEEYVRVMGTNPSTFRGDNSRPVETLSWVDATNYCAKLTLSESAAGRLPSGCAYRLPTEAEWEYACRAGTTTATAYGNSLSSTQANFNGNYPYGGAAKGPYLAVTTKVGSYSANAWGLYDMHGNVYEWCLDWYGDYRGGIVTDPRGPTTGSSRVFRGGGWSDDSRGCRSAYRNGLWPDSGDDYIGFRPVLAPSP